MSNDPNEAGWSCWRRRRGTDEDELLYVGVQYGAWATFGAYAKQLNGEFSLWICSELRMVAFTMWLADDGSPVIPPTEQVGKVKHRRRDAGVARPLLDLVEAGRGDEL